MLLRSALTMVALALASWIFPAAAQVLDLGKYPDLKGQWRRAPVPGAVGQPPHDPSKPFGRGQQAPLTPEYQAIFEANLKDQAEGGRGNDLTRVCLPNGMPRAMSAYEPLEFIITSDVTYILIDHIEHTRRIYTDGRAWPVSYEPSFIGTSMGKWIDEDGDGIYDVLEVETRGFKGPRIYDIRGLPLHYDNQSVFKERFHLDKDNPNILHDEITVTDNALTRPWTVDKRYVRNATTHADWPESICPEYNANVVIGKENYWLSADGFLMPSKKDQPPPDLKYFQKK
jgi:hypothetical protein